MIAHGDEGHAALGYVQAPLYGVSGDHRPALVAVLVGVPLLAAVLAATAGRPAVARIREGYAALAVERRVAVWALVVSALAHLGLLPGHGWSPLSVAFAADTVLLSWAAHRLVTVRRRATLWASLALLGSIGGLVVTASRGEPPDQVAMACKLVELGGLLALWAPSGAPSVASPAVRRRLPRARRVLGVAGVVVVASALAAPVWASELAAGGQGHHLGGTAPLGALIPVGEDREPTAAERVAAQDLYDRTRAALARYADPAAAVRDGYAATDIRGTSFHAENSAYVDDGRTLDPTRPETLVYAQGPRGPVLLGAMFQMPWDVPGPAVGGPLTVWHAHGQVCVSLLPPAIAGVTSPYGLCPAGTLTLGRTNEMLHVWTVPGAPERFGDLPEDWVKRYVTDH